LAGRKRINSFKGREKTLFGSKGKSLKGEENILRYCKWPGVNKEWFLLKMW
jgi:hypothetical protein